MLDLQYILSFYPEELQPFKINILREYLQYKILESVFRSKYGSGLSFMGGTCIHIIHGSPRFSEDLDFDNRGLSLEDFNRLAARVEKDLQMEGYIVEMQTKFTGAFHAFFRFPSILYESGLSGHKRQKILIQIDMEPQEFEYIRHSVLLNRFDVLCRIHIVPDDILLAQKFFCILSRSRPIGRDFYDAVYLMGKTRANLSYLQLKLGIRNLKELKERLLLRCEELDLEKLASDVKPFVIKPRDIEKVQLFAQVLLPHLDDIDSAE